MLVRQGQVVVRGAAGAAYRLSDLQGKVLAQGIGNGSEMALGTHLDKGVYLVCVGNTASTVLIP